jgi:hypothetical protein
VEGVNRIRLWEKDRLSPVATGNLRLRFLAANGFVQALFAIYKDTAWRLPFMADRQLTTFYRAGNQRPGTQQKFLASF